MNISKLLKKNKLICIIMALSLIVNVIYSFAAFADEQVNEYTVNTNYDVSWNVTKGLGINMYDNSQRTEKVTRAEFAGFLYNTFLERSEGRFKNAFLKDGGSDEFAQTVSAFNDVTVEDLYFKEINTVAAVGYMSGDENSNFGPNENVTYIQALKVFLTIAGYNSVAVTERDWTVGYYKLARKLDMCIDNNDLNSEIAKEEVMEIFYNFLQINVLSTDSITNNNVQYSSKNSDTVLKDILHINLYEGQMTYNGYSYISYDTNSNSGDIVVDNKTIKTGGEIPVLGLLCRNVTAYCDENDNLIYIYANDEDDVTRIDAKDINSFDGETIHYYENQKSKSISVKGYPVIFNGHALASYNAELFDFEFGSVVISKKDKYVNITQYDNVVVSSIDSYNRTIYDEVNSKNIAIDDVDALFIYNSDNERITFDDIQINDVILVVNTDGYKEMYVSNKSVSGTLEKIDEGSKKITVSSKNYDVADCVDLSEFKVSSNVRIYVNTMGLVSYIKYDLSGNDFVYGYVVKSTFADQFNSIYKSKIFCQDGSFHIYEYASKVKVTDRENNTSRVEAEKLGDIVGEYVGLMRYKLNVDGLINCIEMPLKSRQYFADGQDRLVERYVDSTGSNCYRTETKSFGYDTFLDASVKIFSIPDDLTKEDDFAMVDLGELVDIETNTLYAYHNEFETAIPEAVVINNRQSKKAPTPAKLGVVSKIYEKYENGETYDCADIYESGTKMITVQAKRDGDTRYFDSVSSFVGLRTHKIEVGDIVSCVYKSDTFEIISIAVVFSANENSPAGLGAKKGMLTDCGYIASEQRYSDKYFIYSDLYNEYVSGVTKFDSISSFIAPITANDLTGQNPLRVSTLGVARKNAHVSYGDGYAFLLGYVVDKSNMFVKLTTQDLSASDYIESGITEVEDTYLNGTTSYTGIYFQRYYKLAQSWANHILVEYTDRGVTVRSANFNDIFTYQDAGRNCSRIITYKNNTFIIINDYRTYGG